MLAIIPVTRSENFYLFIFFSATSLHVGLWDLFREQEVSWMWFSVSNDTLEFH